MARSTSTRAEVKRPSAIVRVYQHAHSGWRKIATAAAAVLAVGMGYHIIFGQNGLTAYQQKRQDAQALQMQLRSLQRENAGQSTVKH